MSRTLFWYIFADLFRVFMMASGALAGIMSFGGLLRPLTQQGLDAAQVGKMLTYLSPAMSAYSFPIAALFATSVIYGRLGADNEIVAARAGGISHLALAAPAIVLGLIVSLISMLFLWYIVPTYTLKVEQVIYSNVAKLVAGKIERNHQFKTDAATIYAQSATVLPTDPARPDEQRLMLVGPMIVSYEKQTKPDDGAKLQVPTEFYMARSATVYIAPRADDEGMEFSVVLDQGVRFPRRPTGGLQGGIAEATFGPMPVDSPIKENTKFMVVGALNRLYERPWRSRKVRALLDEFIAEDQQVTYLTGLAERLAGGDHTASVDAAGERLLIAADGCGVKVEKRELVITARPGTGAAARVRVEQRGQTVLTADGPELRVGAVPLADERHMNLTVRMAEAALTVGGEQVRKREWARVATVPMPPDVRAIERNRTQPDRYATADGRPSTNQRTLARELIVLRHNIQSEVHGRAAFAVSCFALVLVGCALGLMFKSGNFLSAFAVSFVPALLCITLIIAGQRTAQNVPLAFWKHPDTLNLGLGLIWSGNAAVFALGVALLWRLQRQ